jgi:hypothetical protein
MKTTSKEFREKLRDYQLPPDAVCKQTIAEILDRLEDLETPKPIVVKMEAPLASLDARDVYGSGK